MNTLQINVPHKTPTKQNKNNQNHKKNKKFLDVVSIFSYADKHRPTPRIEKSPC